MTHYFDYFPQIAYSFDGRSSVLLTDFMRRVAVPKSVKENMALYELYDIVDGDTPEIVADKVYRNPNLHWIILMVNEIVDPRFDWCMTHQSLVSMCHRKYTDINAVHHYEADGLVVDSTYPGAQSVSNFQYEDRLNEEKRSIRVIAPVFVDMFIKQFEQEINK